MAANYFNEISEKVYTTEEIFELIDTTELDELDLDFGWCLGFVGCGSVSR